MPDELDISISASNIIPDIPEIISSIISKLKPGVDAGYKDDQGRKSISVTSGATFAKVGKGTYFNVIATGTGTGGTDEPSVIISSDGGFISGATALDGATIASVNKSTIYSGYAGSNASIAAAQGGVVSGAVIGSSGALAATIITNNGGGAMGGLNSGGTFFDPHVLSGGYGLAGGGGPGFKIKGYNVQGSGGFISGGTFEEGSMVAVGKGGTVVGGDYRGLQFVQSNGQTFGNIFSGHGATQLVNGGLASRSTALGGGQILVSGATGVGITAGSGGTVLVAGGTYESVLTSDHSTSAGNYSKGYSVGNTVLSGGTEIVGSDGYATSSVITSGGVELISDGGSAIQTTVQSGGEVYVSSGGVALQTVNSGYVDVQSGGYLGSGTNVDNGKIVIENGGSGGGLQINGGELVMQNGAIGSDITVNSGGLGSILSGAFVDKLTVSGGEAVMNSGATAGAIAVTGDPNNQGHLSFLGGAVIQNGVVSAGRAGVVDIGSGASVFSAAAYGDDTTNAVPNAAGTIILSSAAIEHVSVQKGGVISAGADSYINDLFISGGTAYLFSGAQIQGNQAFVRGDYTTVINDPKYHHGDLHIMSGAGLDDVVASAGGRLYVHGGAHINNAVATRRGEVIVESGGSIDTATITTNRNVGGAMLVPGSMFVDNGGEVGSALVSGGQVEIASGGHVGSATIAFASGSGGVVTIDESGTLDSALVASGGTATVISGGTLTSATVTTAGSAVVGGVVDQLVISGGYGTVQAGATVGDVQILAGGSGLFLSGASAISITVASGGWVGGPTVTDGHSLTVYSGGTSVGAVITSKDDASRTASGGSMTSTTIVGAVQSGSLGGILTIESGAVMTQTSMGYNARLRILGFKYDSEGTTFVQNGKLVVTENGQTWTLDLMGNYPDSEGQSSPDNGFQLLDDGYGNTIIIYDKCFLPGTLLRLEKGETAVENVKKGDRIFVYENGQKSVREVTSVLKRHSVVNKNMPDELAGWAVQVCKDAFAPGVPSQDLFVTPEHCFYLEGRFVPARMLVNGASIRYDYSQDSYDYYHVETELHSVIWANNTLTESYLNTGERRSIKSENEDMGRIVRLRELTWHNDAAAPLEVSRDFVEPLYNNFRERAVSLGYKEADLQAQKQNYTEDSQLRLILDNGTVIEKSRESNGRAIFYLPANARGVRLVSNSFRPSATIGPFIDDRRDLGVLVGKVELWVGGREIDVTAHLERDNLPGWSVVEAGPHRWTMGDAFLPLPECYVPEGERMLLSIQLEAGGPYPISSVSDSPALSA